MRALKEYNVKNLIVAGGVAANKGLRTKLEELCKENDISLTVPYVPLGLKPAWASLTAA